MSNVLIGSSEIQGFQPQSAGADIALSGVGVTLDSDQVTFVNPLPPSVVGLSGFKISLGTPAVTYTVESVESRTALTLTTNYLATTGTVTGTLHKLVHLRVYVLTPFVPSGESFVAQSGAPGSTAWFRRYGVSVISDGTQNVAHVPEIVLPATTDSNVPTARYFGGLYTAAGAFIQAYPGCVDQWQLSHLTTPTSWAMICNFNIPPPPTPILNPDSFVTEQELNARFPSGVADQLLYFEEAGNVLDPLTLGAEFEINAGVLELSAQFGVTRIQEEGVNLPQQNTLNFVGSSFTAADDAGNDRTNVTADADLDAIASNTTNGLYARTGAGTVVPRTITGTANRIGVTDGDGVAGNPTLDIGTDVVTLIGTQTLTDKTLTAPRIGTAILDTGGNEIIRTPATGSAVNDITITNAPTGNAPSIASTGDDTNVGMTVATKGLGDLFLTTGADDGILISGLSAETFFGNGRTNPTPLDWALGATGGSGMNIAGADLDLFGGKGTGNGVPGFAAVRYPLIGAGGTTLQSLSTDRFPVSTVQYTTIGTGTSVTNTVVETSVFTGMTASAGSTRTIEAGSARSGTVYRIRLYVEFLDTGTPTIRFKIKFGSVTIADSQVVTAPTGVSGLCFMDANIYVLTVGATGLVRADFEGRISSVQSGAATITSFVGATGTPVVDFTANQLIDATAQWGTASTSNTVTLLAASIERIR